MNAQFVNALAEKVREQRAADLAAHTDTVNALRAELAELRDTVKSFPIPKDGKDGKDGINGKDATVDEAAIVASVIAQIPTPENGKDGKDGEKGIDGRDGRDGKDGIASMDDLRAEVAKTVESATAAEVEKRVAETFASLPVLRYRGVYKQGEEYQPGECATFGGSLFHCNEPTTEKPETGKAWTLAVKRGRDGKDVR